MAATNIMTALRFGLASLALLACASSADARWFGGGAASGSAMTCLQGSSYTDGCAAAVPALTQITSVLSGYAARPPWNVAGMDYAVGVPTATTLQDPTTASLPSGAAYNSGTHTVTVSGSNVTLNGFDFSLHNQTLLVVTGANDIIENSKFVVGSNSSTTTRNAITFTSASTAPSLINCEVDGANLAGTLQLTSTIIVQSTGTVSFKYNYFHNSGEDMIDFSASTGTMVNDVRYNMWKDIGTQLAHQDTMQWFDTTIGSGSDIGFNTVYQTTDQSGGGNGMIVPLSEGSSSTMTGLSVHNSTIITTAGCAHCNFATGFYDDLSGTSDHVSVYENWVDPTGINLWTGSPWFANGKTTSPATSALANPMIEYNLHNMLVGGGPTIAIPSFSSQTGQGYYVYPDINGLSPSQSSIFSEAASPSSGNVTTGNPVTITLTMPGPGWTVTGSPRINLNTGGIATYSSGSGTSSLVFTYTVGGGDATTGLAITSFNLNGGTIKDAFGNTAVLTGPLTTFTGLAINTAPSVHMTSVPTTGATSSSVAFTFSYLVSAPTGMTCVWNPGSLSGGAVTSFSAGGGNGSGNCPTPATAASYTMSVTGTGPNTASATAANATTLSASGSCAQGSSYADGCPGAPVASIQYPTLLNGEALRPPWNVAGVDYAVGYPTGTTLTSAATVTIAGCSFASHQMTCTGSNRVVDKVDFTVSSGVNLDMTGCTNCTVSNSLFGGSNYDALSVSIIRPGNGVTIVNNIVDGHGDNGSIQSFMIGPVQGTVVIEYNWFKNYPEEVVSIGGTTTLTYLFNLIDQCVVESGGHQNFLQSSGAGTATVTTNFNTSRQTILAGGEGFQFYNNTSGQTVVNPTATNNTLYTSGSPGYMSYLMHGPVPDSTISGNCVMSENYFDTTGAYGAFYGGSFTGCVANVPNKNMVTGATISFP